MRKSANSFEMDKNNNQGDLVSSRSNCLESFLNNFFNFVKKLYYILKLIKLERR